MSIKYLDERGIDTSGLTSQSWDEFEEFGPDLVVTVCDSAAGESCPVWFGKSLKMHWGLSDPSKLEGTEQELKDAFDACIDEIQDRVKGILTLPVETLSRDELKGALKRLGAR